MGAATVARPANICTVASAGTASSADATCPATIAASASLGAADLIATFFTASFFTATVVRTGNLTFDEPVNDAADSSGIAIAFGAINAVLVVLLWVGARAMWQRRKQRTSGRVTVHPLTAGHVTMAL